MKFTISMKLAALSLVLCAGSLLAQSPPYGGYTNSPYYYGPYSGTGMSISNVVIKQGTTTLLTNASGASASPFNTYYGAVPPANMIPGLQHTIEVSIPVPYPTYATAWIDYDNNGTFNDTTEYLGASPTSAAGGTVVITFTASASVGGVKRCRIRSNYSTPITQCYAQGTYGEAEDYLMNFGFAISTQSPLPTAAQGSVYNQTIQATNGVVPYTWNTTITGLPPGIVPMQSGNALTLSGTPTTVGNYTFTLNVSDSATPTPAQASRQFQIDVVPPPAAMPFSDDFSTAKGWQLGNTWTRGAATAYNPTSAPPRSEPGTDATASSTDDMILGDNIGGDYQINQTAVNWAIAPMVNCSTGTNVKCRIRRWLGNAIGSEVRVQCTNNGTVWNDVWVQSPQTGQSTIRDTAWNLITYNIGQWANGSATFQMRFGIGPTGGTAHTGWCIDDYEVFDAPTQLEVREGGATGTIITSGAPVGGLRDFGNVPVGTQSAPLTIAVNNNTPSSVSFQSPFTKAGANPNDFYVSAPGSTFPNPLPSGQTGTFTIIFYVMASATQGVYTASITMTHNAGGMSGQTFTINVRATAVPAAGGTIECRLTSQTGSVISHNQTATGTIRDFGNQDPAAGPTAPITIWVRNTGTGTLYMTPPDLGGTWYTEFVVDNTGFTSSLTSMQWTSFKVSFDPTSVGVKDAIVRIPCTDTSVPMQVFNIPVLGTGATPAVNPAILVKEGGAMGATLPHGAPAPGSPRDFGTQLISAGATAAYTIYIENSGGGTLTLGTPTLGGTGASHYVLNTTGYQTSLGQGASTTFTIAFDPSSVGVKDASITITHNDTSKTNPFVINVTGNGAVTAAVIVVKAPGIGGATLSNPAPATGALNFGNRDIGAGPSASVQIFIENTGTSPMTLGNPALGGSGAAHFTLNTTGYSLTVNAGASTSFTIAFDPSTTGTKNATCSFTHTATTSTTSPFVINVTGNGIPSGPVVEVREGSATGSLVAYNAAAVSAGGRDLGAIDVAAGATASKTIFIVNAGTQPLTLAVPTLTGPDAAMFTLNTTGFTTTVAAAGSTSFSMTFDPTNVGVKDAVIEFTHNDTLATSPFLVPILGTGTSASGVLITTTSLPAGSVGDPYPATTLAASQGTPPYTWSLRNSTLPPGLSLSAAGDITGTPTGSGGSFSVTFRVTDSTGGTNDSTFSMAISNAPGLSGPGGGGCSTEESANAWFVLFAALAALAMAARLRKA